MSAFRSEGARPKGRAFSCAAWCFSGDFGVFLSFCRFLVGWVSVASPSLQHQLFSTAPHFSFIPARLCRFCLPPPCTSVPAVPATAAPSCCFRHASAHSRGFSPCQLSPPAPASPVSAASAVLPCSPPISAASTCSCLPLPALTCLSSAPPLSSSPPPRKRFRFSPPHPSMNRDSLLRSAKNRLRYRNRLLIRKELLPLR